MRKLISGVPAVALVCALAACAEPAEPAAPTTPAEPSTTTVTTTVTATPGPCTPETITSGNYQYEEFVMMCDGTWKYAGQPASDHTWFAKWDGASWVPFLKDGAHADTYLPCYNPETLRSEGMPEELVRKFQDIGPVCAGE